jgi:pimeloyl-ACP methyl ester carboxylesterase
MAVRRRADPVDSGRLRPLVAGAHGPDPRVVLLHGQPGDRHDWDEVVLAVGDRVSMLVPDRPGYGRTGGPAGGFAANADAVVELLDRRRIERVVLAGYSWGGGVALAAALKHPDRVSGLVLVSSVGGQGSTGQIDRLLAAPVLGPALAVAGLAALRAARVRRLLAPVHAPSNPKAVDALPSGWLRSWRSFVAEERGMLRELPGLTERLAEIRAPAVVLIGDADRVVRPPTQEALAAALPGADCVRVPGCGHLLPREAPRVVADAMVRMASAGDAKIEV